MTYETGRVVAVNVVYLGDELASSVGAGADFITVRDAADFTEDGGFLRLNGEVLQYVTADDETGVITLASPLVTAAEEADAVEVWDFDAEAPAQEVVAHVAAEGEDFSDDALEAIVAHSLIPYLREGIRETDGEVVTLEWRGDDLYVVDLPNRRPVMDGTLIDPTTLPETGGSGPASDGLAPSNSPTPTVVGGIRALFISWTPVGNADPVTYDVYTSPTTPVALDEANLIGSTPGTFAHVEALPSGLPLEEGTTYHVAIVARDVDGAAPVSTEGSATVQAAADPALLAQLQTDLGTLETDLATANSEIDAILPITETKISDGAVTTNKIVSGAIVTDHMTANSINGDRILANTLNANRIVAGSITTDRMTANSINGDRILANTLHANKIQAGTITADRIQSGAISALLVNGDTIQTRTEANRGIKISGVGNSLVGYSPTGVETFRLDADEGAVSIMGTYRSGPDNEARVVIRDYTDPQSAYGRAVINMYPNPAYTYLGGSIAVASSSSSGMMFIEGPYPSAAYGQGGFPPSISLYMNANGSNSILLDTDSLDLGAARINLTSSGGINFGHGGQVLQRIDFGTYVGSTNASGYINIPHNLGVTPAAVAVMSGSHFGQSYNIVYNPGGSSASNINVLVKNHTNTAIGNTTLTLTWIAMQ